MTSSQLEKLLFAQGQKCFFCKKDLARNEASVEHLVAKANGGNNINNENCVACCKSINSLFGSLPLKNKIEIILNQKGAFKCPSKKEAAKKPPGKSISKEEHPLKYAITDLKKRGNARPKKLKTLVSTIGAIPKLKGIKNEDVMQIIKQLEASKKIVITGEKVSYSL